MSICVLSADDLRREPLRISRGVSWERTLETLSDALADPALLHLKKFAYLIITLGCDGALLVDQRRGSKATFCFHPASIEEDLQARVAGHAIGFLTAMTASITVAIAAAGKIPDLGTAMRGGLRAMRDLLEKGHGKVETHQLPSGYPFKRIAGIIHSPQAGGLATMELNWPLPSIGIRKSRASGPHGEWTLVAASQSRAQLPAVPSLAGIAAAVVRGGRRAFGLLPHVEFGEFVSMERGEIEALRVIRSQMRRYKDEAKVNERPLSVGVFGPPGAGKSFAVKEIAKATFGKEAWIEFNLSQFNDAKDLIGALHQVRDKVLEGVVPVVFWDEFDSRVYEWLKYLLAPMQDGRFQEGQVTHTIGRCVFVFAGGTSYSFGAFGPPAGNTDPAVEKQWRDAKGPDFKSRLDAFYDVSGPNQRTLVTVAGKWRPDPADNFYPIRRALMLRAALRPKSDDALDIDPGLLAALLFGPAYANGARSFQKLVKALASGPRAGVWRSNLPPPAQLGMLLSDIATFEKLLEYRPPVLTDAAIGVIAADVHATWLAKATSNGTPPTELDMPFQNLDPKHRALSNAAATRIPALLALVGMTAVPSLQSGPGIADADVDAHIAASLERLAEAEHNGWWERRILDGWSYDATRNDDKKQHDCMIEYDKLREYNKDYDRTNVRAMRERLQRAHYRVVWLTAPA